MRGLCEFQQGAFHAPSLGWALDATEPRETCFVSHAHSDHTAEHGLAICTAETAALLPLWFEEGKAPRMRVVGWRQWQEEGARWRLLPSGHIAGAAMLHLETSDGSMLYAGDVRRSGSLTCPPAEIVRASHLIIEDTFGAVDAPFVDHATGAEMALEACRRILADGGTPVFVTMSNCGKAQDLVCALGRAGLRPALQPKLWRFTERYRSLGLVPACYGRLAHKQWNECDACLVTQSYLEFQGWDLSRMVADPVYILLSGWAATDDGCFYESAIPWSDHASREELLAIVEQARPELVWTFAGEGELAERLRRRGLAAEHFDLD